MLQASITVRSIEDDRSKEFLLIAKVRLSAKTDLMTVNLVQEIENPFSQKLSETTRAFARNPKVLN